jgi:hypothetical protein
MRHAFVLAEEQGKGSLAWERARAVVKVDGPIAELTDRLRPWALATAMREDCCDGRYSAYLVELDDEGQYDTYLALAFEDIIWFYGKEHAPVS